MFWGILARTFAVKFDGFACRIDAEKGCAAGSASAQDPVGRIDGHEE